MIHSMKTQSYGPMENKKEEDTYVSTCGYCVCACVCEDTKYWKKCLLQDITYFCDVFKTKGLVQQIMKEKRHT